MDHISRFATHWHSLSASHFVSCTVEVPFWPPYVSTGFLDPVLGAMMKQACWHSRRSKAYRGCPRHAWQELLWKKPPLRTSICGRHQFRRNHPLWEPRMWQGQVWEARPDGESIRGKAKFRKRHGSRKWEEENSATRRRHRGKEKVCFVCGLVFDGTAQWTVYRPITSARLRLLTFRRHCMIIYNSSFCCD